MAIGLRVINDDSHLLIDSEYVNPTFVRKVEFNTTAVREEAPGFYLHREYILREYTTDSITAPGNYIALWTIPENFDSTMGGHKNVWYSFPTSVASGTIQFSCYVFSSVYIPATYNLPTAYVFAVDSASVSNLYSTGPALRMYNSASGKTFDSNLTQLVPYSFSDEAIFSYNTTSDSTIILSSIPNNPIFLLPNSDILSLVNRRVFFNNYPGHIETVSTTTFLRVGSTVSVRSNGLYSAQEDTTLPQDTYLFRNGSSDNLNLMVADADFYQAPGAGNVGGNTPQYQLTSNYYTVDEGATFTITLATTLTTNGTVFPYTVTGISAADLTVGSLEGDFVIQGNSATQTFTVRNDLQLEGNESFTLNVQGLNLTVSVAILDTSKPAGVYGFGAVSPIDEDNGNTYWSGYVNFEYQYAAGKSVTFAIVAPTSGVAATSADVTLNFFGSPYLVINQSNMEAGTFGVGYNAAADTTTEGPEYFRISATVDSTTYYSDNILINDTSLTAVSHGITASNNWLESSTGNVANVTATGVNGSTLYFTTDNPAVVPQTASATVNSNNYNVNVSYNVGFVTTATNVTLQVRTGSASGSVVATKVVSIANANPTYYFGAVSSISEGSTGSVQFNYSNSAGVSFGFSATYPGSGEQADGSSDVTVNTTDFTVGNTDAAGTVSVSYSVAADGQTENTEYFRIQAYINGLYYTSDDILISDTSQSPAYSLVVNNAPWNENTTQSTTVTLINVAGYTYYPTSDNGSVTCQTSSFYVNSNSFTTTLYWNVGAVSADTTVNLYLRRSRSSGTIDAQASVTVRNILAAGTAIGAAFCLNNGVSPYTLRQVRADGSGGTYNDDINNSTTCGYVAPTARGIYHSQFCGTGANQYTLYFKYHDGNYGFYDEVHQTNSPSCGYVDPPVYAITSPLNIDESTTQGRATLLHYNIVGSKTVTISAVAPSSGANGAGDVVVVTTSLTVTGNGTPTIYYYANPDSVTEGTEYFRLQAVVDGSVVSTSDNISISDTSVYPAAGTAIGGAFCVTYSAPYTLRQVRANGSGGTYNDDTNNSPTCGYVAPTPRGTYLSQYCSGYTLYYRYADGNYGYYDQVQQNNSPTCGYNPPAYGTYLSQYCSGFSLYYRYADGAYGSYDVLQANNSPSCGYVAPSYSLGSTFSSLNNGAGTAFYLYVTNPVYDNVYVSASGAGAARISVIDPGYFTTNTGTNIYYIYVYTTTPTSSVPAESVTITVAHNNGAVSKSFSFTIPEYTVAASAPIVTSVQVSDATYYAGEGIQAVINFSGIITADTYINIRIDAGAFGQLYYPSNGGAAQSYTAGAYADYVILTVGTYSGYYAGPVNPGGFYPPIQNCRVNVKAVTASGFERQAYVSSLAFALDGGMPP